MTEADKKPYVQISTQDQARFDQEVMQLQTNGFFISKDGVKSTDMTKKVNIVKRAIYEKAGDIIQKAMVLAKLDLSSKSGFEVFKVQEYETICNKF